MAGYSTCKGKGKGKGKGSGKQWQIMLENQWQDYGVQEHRILKRAYMTGQKNARFCLRGQSYEYSFGRMVQINKGTNKERRIRPPVGSRLPRKPLLPQGPMIVVTVGTGQPGTIISISDPNNPGQMMQVYVPPHAKPGQKMAVPVPAKGESVADVQKKQEKHDVEHGIRTGWSTGAKVAASGAAVAGIAAVGVGGVILGDHLAGGEMASSIGEAADDAADAVGEWAPEAAEDVADFAGDAADWLGDAGEDIGDFVTDLF